MLTPPDEEGALSGNPAALSRLPVHEERDESTGSTTRAPTDSHGGPSGPAFPGPMRERDEVAPNRKDRADACHHDVRAGPPTASPCLRQASPREGPSHF